jgi:hypothetical protein
LKYEVKMLLRQISPSDPVTAVVIDGLERSCPILSDAQFYSRPGPADSVKRAKDTEEKEEIFRELNTNNTAQAFTRTYDPVVKKIVSFDTKADVALEDRNEDPEAELAQETRVQAESVGYTLQEKFFEGDVDDDEKEFNGMRELTAATGKIVFANDSADGVVLALGNSDMAVAAQQTAIESLLKFFACIRGGASHAYMNEYLKVRWLTIAKNLGYYRQSKDELGNLIDMIGGTVIRGAGYTEPGTPLLPFTEENNSSSIFACRWGERVDLTVLTSVGVKGRYAGQIGNFLINNVNMDAVMHLQNPTALYQCKGWKLA